MSFTDKEQSLVDTLRDPLADARDVQLRAWYAIDEQLGRSGGAQEAAWVAEAIDRATADALSILQLQHRGEHPDGPPWLYEQEGFAAFWRRLLGKELYNAKRDYFRGRVFGETALEGRAPGGNTSGAQLSEGAFSPSIESIHLDRELAAEKKTEKEKRERALQSAVRSLPTNRQRFAFALSRDLGGIVNECKGMSADGIAEKIGLIARDHGLPDPLGIVIEAKRILGRSNRGYKPRRQALLSQKDIAALLHVGEPTMSKEITAAYDAVKQAMSGTNTSLSGATLGRRAKQRPAAR